MWQFITCFIPSMRFEGSYAVSNSQRTCLIVSIGLLKSHNAERFFIMNTLFKRKFFRYVIYKHACIQCSLGYRRCIWRSSLLSSSCIYLIFDLSHIILITDGIARNMTIDTYFRLFIFWQLLEAGRSVFLSFPHSQSHWNRYFIWIIHLSTVA